ncbi:MAG: hypothetical protein GY750_20855 [Lentisphaerae bacterium]|nr:hypothetical protein [Lentisphaerota bacterium]
MATFVKVQSRNDYLINLDNVDAINYNNSEIVVHFNGDEKPCYFECNQTFEYIFEQITNGDKTIRILV